ncbi:MAG: hypothetical protein JW801_16620 [Bacteroidales bacterium]|nr:hypothetical protein [Bacteroidales bacterium]
MKKNYYKLFFLLVPAILIATSCIRPRNTEPDLQTVCESKGEAVSEAATVFINNMTETTCEDYKDALTDYVDACRLYAAYNASYEEAISEWDCSDYAK